MAGAVAGPAGAPAARAAGTAALAAGRRGGETGEDHGHPLAEVRDGGEGHLARVRVLFGRERRRGHHRSGTRRSGGGDSRRDRRGLVGARARAAARGRGPVVHRIREPGLREQARCEEQE